MPTTRKQNLSGPKPRQTLDSVRRSSYDDVAPVESLAFISPEINPNTSSNCSLERVLNDTFLCGSTDDVIDSDNSNSDAVTEDDESISREGTPTPIGRESTPVNRSQKTPAKQNMRPPDTSFHQLPGLSAKKDAQRGTILADGIAKRKTPLKKVESPKLNTEFNSANPLREAENGTNCPNVMIIVSVILFVGGYASYKMYHQKSSSTIDTSPPGKSETCEKFYTLEATYTNVDDMLWDSLEVSFLRANAVQKRREPGTFLFLHKEPTKVVDRFIDNVTKITAECFGGTQPIVLGSKYFQRADIERDFGQFLSEQMNELRKQGVMVVRNLEDVPPKAAQAFHSICDPEEPMVDQAVIYFTLDTSKVAGTVPNSGEEQSATAEAEKLLYRIWNDALKPEVLDPLITRLTENVFRIV